MLAPIRAPPGRGAGPPCSAAPVWRYRVNRVPEDPMTSHDLERRVDQLEEEVGRLRGARPRSHPLRSSAALGGDPARLGGARA